LSSKQSPSARELPAKEGDHFFMEGLKLPKNGSYQPISKRMEQNGKVDIPARQHPCSKRVKLHESEWYPDSKTN